jgi:hypothetical protein
MVTVEGEAVVAAPGAIVKGSALASSREAACGCPVCDGGSSSQGRACAKTALENKMVARNKRPFFESSLVIGALSFLLR